MSADPLLDLINAYHAGVKAYDDHPTTGDDALWQEMVGCTLDKLDAWTEPTTTWESAMAALRLADTELMMFQTSPLAKTMLTVALAYLEKLPAPVQELENLNDCIEAHRAALAAFAAVADPADAPEEETQAADDAETAAFNELLKFPCQTKEAKARKTEYVVERLGRNRFSLELDIDQFETRLQSPI
ncbi:hypothetical protein [Rhizobium sp. SYY.PMSO]|uniref:hypothetical protein n=1 Tax=Rhizobium sp. SYY.PMSO TaxID=3382192 RepID=UPI00399025FE